MNHVAEFVVMMGRKTGRVSKPQKEDKSKLKKALETEKEAGAGK